MTKCSTDAPEPLRSPQVARGAIHARVLDSLVARRQAPRRSWQQARWYYSGKIGEAEASNVRVESLHNMMILDGSMVRVLWRQGARGGQGGEKTWGCMRLVIVSSRLGADPAQIEVLDDVHRRLLDLSMNGFDGMMPSSIGSLAGLV